MLKIRINESDVKGNIDSFKSCIKTLMNRLGNGYNLEISLCNNAICYNICHKKSPIPSQIGELNLLDDGNYKIIKYNV